MSRVGKYPVIVPDGVAVAVDKGVFVATGASAEQRVAIGEFVEVRVADSKISVTPRSDAKRARQSWGTIRALIQNAVTGVNTGFTRRLELNGVGYRVRVEGGHLHLSLGFSHEVVFPIPEDVTIALEDDRRNVIAVSGPSKQRVGQVASNIRAFRPPEPYKGKGIKYAEEILVRKESKKKK